MTTHCERDENRDEAIEITPEMIEAGVAALEDGLSLDSDHWSLVRAVYSAMRGVCLLTGDTNCLKVEYRQLF